MTKVMFWQIRRDFLSLFSRNNGNEIHLDPIDGYRSIASLLIILLHTVSIFGALVSPYPSKDWEDFLHSAAYSFNSLMSFSLEIFFMLSGFFLTYKLVGKWNANPFYLKSYLEKEYPFSILKRALRFWPGLFFCSVIVLVFGEARYPHSTYSFEFFRHLNTWMFFQNYIDFQYWYLTFTPLWSISLDMQVHLILPLVIYIFYLKKEFISLSKSLSILLILSIIRGIMKFDCLKMSIIPLVTRYPSLPLLVPDYLKHWMERNYNLTFSYDIPSIDPMKHFMTEIYLPLGTRFGSFIIGSILAIELLQSFHYSNRSKSSMKYFYFFLIFFLMVSSIEHVGDGNHLPSDLQMKLGVGISRQLFTICHAFLLFTALCPSSHPYHSSGMKRFLSMNIWIPISKLSYLVYLIHLRVSFELIFHGPLNFLTKYSPTKASLIALPFILLFSQFVSAIWFVLLEKPVERATKIYFFNRKSSKLSI